MVRIATADVAVHADTKPFIADLEKLKAIVEKYDKLSVAVHAKLAKGTRASLQAQLKALKPPLTVNVQAKLSGLGELRKILANHIGILGEENQLNAALQEEAKARREIANATAAQARAATAALNQQNAALRLESQRLRLARQQEAALARQTRFLRDHKNILGLELREWRFLSQQILGFSRNLDVTRRAFLINAAASETLLGTLVKVFKRAIDLRKVATQLGTAFAVGFAGAAQAAGALISAAGRAVTAVGVLAGIGLISIGVKLQLNDAEVAQSLNNLKTNFTNVFTQASASLKPVLIGFFDDISAGLTKQQQTFTNFFNKVSGPLGNLGKAVSNFLASEQFASLVDKAGNVTAKFLQGFADRLPGIINGVIRVGETLVRAGKRIREAFGPGVFSSLSFDKVVDGINAVTDALVTAGDGVKAFKKAFGQFLSGVGTGLKNILATIGEVGPKLFGALGPIAKQVAIDIGQVISALIRFASVVLPIAQKAMIEFSDTFSDNLSKALGILAKPLGETVKNIAELGTKLSPLLPILAQIAADLEPVISGLVRLGIAVAPLAVEVARFIEKFASGVGSSLKPFIDAIVYLAGLISKVLTPALKFLNDHGVTEFVGKLAGAVLGVLLFTAAIKGLGGAVGLFTKKDKAKTAALLAENGAMAKGGKIARLFKGALTVLGDAAKTVAGILKKGFSKIPGLAGLGTKIANEFKLLPTRIGVYLIQAGEKISKFFSGIGKFFSGAGAKIAEAFKGIGPNIAKAFSGIGEFFSGLGTRIANVFTGIGPRIASAFSGIGSRIAGFFAPVLNFFKGIGSKIAGIFKGGGAISGFAKSFGGLGSTIAKVAGPLARVAGVIARFAGPIGIIITLILEWRTVWDTLVKGFEIFKTAVEGVIAGISRIIGGFKKLFSGDILGGLGDIFGGLKDVLISALKGAFAGLGNLLSGLWTILWHTLEGIPVIGPLFTKIHDLITQGFNFLKTAFSGAGDFLSGVWTAIKNGASAAWNFIKSIFAPVLSFFSSVFSGIGTVVSGVWTFIKTTFSAGIAFIGSIISGIVQFFSNPIEGIKTIISGAWEFIKSIFSAGVAFIGSIFSGIGTIVSGVWSFITGIFSAGVSTIGSILSGIGSFFSAAFSAVSGIVSGVFNTVRGIIGGVVDFIGSKVSGIGNFFSSAFNTVKTAVSGAINFVKGLIDGLLSSLASIASKVKEFFGGGGDEAKVAAKAPAVDQAAVNAAADQVRKQSEAILLALKELAPKVQAELQNVTNIIAQGFATLGTTIGTQVTGIATQVGTALTALATNLTTTMATLTTTLLTQLVTLATTLTTTLTTTIATALTSLTTSFTTVGASLTAAFTTIFASLGAQATAFFGTALPATVQGGMAALQANLTTGLSAAFQAAFAAVGPVIDAAMAGAFANASGAAQAGMAGIVAAVTSGVGAITAAVAPLPQAIGQPVVDGFAKALAAAQTGVNALVRAVADGASKIRALGQSYFDSGAYIGQRLADGMNSKTEAVRQASMNLAAASKTPLPSSPAKEGPLSGHGDTYYSGQTIVDRLVKGIEERRATIAAVIDKIAATIHDGASGAGINLKLPSGNATVNKAIQLIRDNQDPLAKAIDRLNLTLGALPQNLSRGLSIGFGAAGGGATPGAALTGRFDRSIGGRILKQDTSAAFGDNAGTRIGSNLVQIRPGQINLKLEGIKDPKAFLDELSKELLTLVKGH